MTLMDGPLSGRGGRVEFNSQNVGGVSEWKIDPKIDKKDITAFASSGTVDWKAYMATIKDATITLTLAYLDLADAGQAALWAAFGGTPQTLKLYFNATNYCQCSAWVDSFPLGAKVDDVEGAGTSVTLQIASGGITVA